MITNEPKSIDRRQQWRQRLLSRSALQIERSLWLAELAAAALAYLVYYFIGVELDIIRLPHLLVFVPA